MGTLIVLGVAGIWGGGMLLGVSLCAAAASGDRIRLPLEADAPGRFARRCAGSSNRASAAVK
jgi:hypothetical protein